MKNIGIYVHIPFCVRKCAYCDFLSFEGKADKQGPYIGALNREVDIMFEKYGIDEGTDYVVSSIYFGGGTPTSIKESYICDLLCKLKNVIISSSNMIFSENPEITLEANPGTLSTKKLQSYLEMGISVISMGIQSFNDDVLRTLERIHNKEQAIEAFKMASSVGFKKISIDLMFAIPGQTMEMWVDTVRQAIELNPEHISLYSLEFMEGTKFDKLREDGMMNETDPDIDRRMYETALDMMEEAGYVQYEISNCAKPGFESKHNLKYWNLSEYIGFGPSAHSYYNHARYKNPSSIEEYVENPLNSECYSVNCLEDDIIEYTFTGLRKAEGINLNSFYEKFGKVFWEFYGEDIHKEFNSFAETGFAEETEDRIHLTRKGFNISNKIMGLFV